MGRQWVLYQDLREAFLRHFRSGLQEGLQKRPFATPPLRVRTPVEFSRIERRRDGGFSPPRDPFRPSRPTEEEPRPRGKESPRRIDDEDSRKVRPSTLQKLVKKYNGVGRSL